MSVLVTGASGLIGSALIERLRNCNDLIICQSRASHPDQQGLQWIKHDLIIDTWECLAPYEIDVVYHLAGQTSTYCARKNPTEDLTSNVFSLLNLLEYFRERKQCPFIVVASTATVAGLTDHLPINESLPERPVTFYDLSKLTAEMYLKQYIRDGMANGCALRLPNVFGFSKSGQKRDRGILDKVFTNAATGQLITIYGDGNYLRDYIFIDDAVAAFIAATEHRQQTNGRSFYIGSGEGIALKDAFLKVAAIAGRSTGSEVAHEYAAPPVELSQIEYRNAIIDASAFREATGWKPKYDFDAGIKAAYHARSVLSAVPKYVNH